MHTLVDVRWRDVPLLNNAQLGQVADGSGFLRTKKPMPVGSMLIITPVQNQDIRVPVRVAGVVEVPEAGSGSVQGMYVVFEAAGQLLEPYLEEDQTVVGLVPEPAFDEGREELEYASMSVLEEPEPGPDEEPDLPQASTVVVEAEPVKDSALMPSVSGEIDLGAYAAQRGDPDAPDKVIVEVEAADAGEVEPEGGVEQETSPEEDGEQGGDGEDKKRKRKRRRKKKK